MELHEHLLLPFPAVIWILISMLIISILVNSRDALPACMENSVKDNNDMPGHLARRFQQIAVAVFLAEVGEAGFDLTPVQYAALAAIRTNPGIDQVTLAGLIAYDRTTITGVVDRLVQKGLLVRNPSSRDRRARELADHRRGKANAARDHAGRRGGPATMLRGLTEKEGADLMRLLRKAIAAGNELSRAPLRDAELR